MAAAAEASALGGQNETITSNPVDNAATALREELAALREMHQAEKKELLDNADKLRRRNEELERAMSLQRFGSSSRGSNGRSQSASRYFTGDESVPPAFGSRMKALATRWASPHPRGSGDEEADDNSTINTEDVGQIDFIRKGDDDYVTIIASLKQQLREAETRATVLEQRLQIVKESGDSVIQSLNEELAEVAEESARSESAMIKELSRLDAQRRAERAEFEKRIQEWIAHDANRKLEVEEYERRIESLVNTVRLMDTAREDDLVHCNSSSSVDKEAEEEMHKDLIAYFSNLSGKNSNKRGNPLVSSINDAFDLQFNANPIVGDDLIDYYRSHSELKEFTLKSELPRMDYEVLVADINAKEGRKLVTPEEIRSYFDDADIDEESELCIRCANQSLLADPLAMLTGEGAGKIIHSGSFYSTVIASSCTFKIDLRHEGERRVKIYCELAVCVPSGDDSTEETEETSATSATLELARANLIIQFGPSPTATPSGPLIKYTLSSIVPSLSSSPDDAQALQLAAAALARDRNTHIRKTDDPIPDSRRDSIRSRFLSKVKTFSQSNS
mmetsp:Transcript_24681/g.42038  ORF Transcript_24681/g.42038 Transcript_24681/m.42038 type:complete len:562 (+) Transcript_24681:184-1869(+)